ncbi:SufD family Fe-S cluster assembly protein [Candidatus Dojkabacteria bacterium]|nr:SufD family Fe-S cluster assembly protein [Candidatus Dojkabacteria bacterium]
MKKIVLDFKKENQEIEINEDSEILGLYIGKKNDSANLKLKIIHKKPYLKSNVLIKAVLWDKSKLNFEGDIIIEKGARNTDTYLKADVLIMSEDASARAVPSLEIKEDEVKGGHGATVGQIDQKQLFYLRSRGLPHKEAENVLVEGFIKEITSKMT